MTLNQRDKVCGDFRQIAAPLRLHQPAGGFVEPAFIDRSGSKAFTQSLGRGVKRKQPCEADLFCLTCGCFHEFEELLASFSAAGFVKPAPGVDQMSSQPAVFFRFDLPVVSPGERDPTWRGDHFEQDTERLGVPAEGRCGDESQLVILGGFFWRSDQFCESIVQFRLLPGRTPDARNDDLASQIVNLPAEVGRLLIRFTLGDFIEQAQSAIQFAFGRRGTRFEDQRIHIVTRLLANLRKLFLQRVFLFPRGHGGRVVGNQHAAIRQQIAEWPFVVRQVLRCDDLARFQIDADQFVPLQWLIQHVVHDDAAAGRFGFTPERTLPERRTFERKRLSGVRADQNRSIFQHTCQVEIRSLRPLPEPLAGRQIEAQKRAGGKVGFIGSFRRSEEQLVSADDRRRNQPALIH